MPRLETSDFSSTSLWTEQLQGAETLSSQLRGSGRAPGDTWQSRQLLRTGNKGRPSHTEADAPERCQAPAPPPPPGLPNCHLLRSPYLPAVLPSPPTHLLPCTDRGSQENSSCRPHSPHSQPSGVRGSPWRPGSPGRPAHSPPHSVSATRLPRESYFLSPPVLPLPRSGAPLARLTLAAGWYPKTSPSA